MFLGDEMKFIGGCDWLIKWGLEIIILFVVLVLIGEVDVICFV